MSFLRGDVVLVAYPFSDLSSAKVRPAAVVSSTGDRYPDVFIILLTSGLENLGEGEFILESWQDAGLHFPTAAKRGCFLISNDLIVKSVGNLGQKDIERLEKSLKKWLGL